MILSGMLLRNVNNGLLISGLVPSWSKQIRAAALAIIFLRSGLEIDLDVRPLPTLKPCTDAALMPVLAANVQCRKSGEVS